MGAREYEAGAPDAFSQTVTVMSHRLMFLSRTEGDIGSGFNNIST